MKFKTRHGHIPADHHETVLSQEGAKDFSLHRSDHHETIRPQEGAKDFSPLRSDHRGSSIPGTGGFETRPPSRLSRSLIAGRILPFVLLWMVMIPLTMPTAQTGEHGGVNQPNRPKNACTPTATFTSTPEPTETPPVTETPTPTGPTPTETQTATPEATDTPEPTATPTDTPNVDPDATATPTTDPSATSTPTPTSTLTPTATFTNTPEPTTPPPTNTPPPTDTPSTPTNTPEPTATPSTPTHTPYPTSTPYMTPTPTPVYTPTPHGGPYTPTATPTPHSTNTATPSFTIRFKDAEGQELGLIHRVGISNAYNNRSQTILAVVSPESLTFDVTFSVSPKLNMTVLSRVPGTITLSVVGTSESIAQGDEWIRAKVQSQSYTQQISVVIPKYIATPHPQQDGNVPCKYTYVDYSTIPRYGGCLPPDPTPEPAPSPGTPTPTPVHYVMLIRNWAHLLEIHVIDQFTDSLINTYTNAIVEEYVDHCLNGTIVKDWCSINILLNDHGVYYDSVGLNQFRQPEDPVNLYDDIAQEWINKPSVPFPDDVEDLHSIRVRIDGFELQPSPAIQDRKSIGYFNTNRLQIVWP